MKRIFTKISVLTAFCLFTLNVAQAQNITIKGTVTDGGDKSPLPGVSVLVKGTQNGVQTDANGSYTISAPANASLIFNFIGYEKKEEAINNRTSINVALAASTNELEQVVVVGYGTQKKKDLTGSIASVKGEDIAREQILAPTQAVQGKVAGVQVISAGSPNSLPTIRVRGTGTMLAGANPLYVVDGVITDDIRNINAADIVSMDILKDASATAIYGMRAANGVLLITTKKGKSGKIKIDYTGSVGYKEIARKVNLASPEQYATYINEANRNGGDTTVLITPAMLQSGTSTDWYDAILKKGLQQNHNLSLSGGSESFTYFLSAGYIQDAGIVKTNDFNRFTLRSNNEYNAAKWLKITSLVSYSRYNLQDINNDVFTNAYRAAPYVASKIGDLYGNTSLSNNLGNPLLNLEKTDNNTIGQKVQGTFSVDVKPLSWLSFRSSYGVDLDFNAQKIYNYAFTNDGPGNVFLTNGGNQIRQNSDLTVTNINTNRWVWDNTITATKSFDKHNFSLLIGATAERFSLNNLSGNSKNVPTDKNLWYLSAGSTIGASNSNIGDRFTRNSYLSRLTYNYDEKYLLTATMRADGTSRFASNNRWGYFPSVGLGWNIIKEDFMQNQKIFSALKLRASYGKVGNDQIPTSTYFSIATINVPYFYDGNQYLGISFDNLPDKNVRWETTREYDLGLELGFLKNRLTAQIDYYNKRTENALIGINIPGILGDIDSKFTTNAASFENKGIELSINWADKINEDWSYAINVNGAYNQNKIIGLNGGQALFDGSVGQGFTTKSDNGQPIGSFFILQADGIFQNATEIAASAQKDAKPGDLRYKDISGPNGVPDGQINDFDRAYSGSFQPKVTYGINGNITYKAFDLNIATYGTAGGKIYNAKKASRPDSRDNIEASVAQNRWTPNNTGTGVPRAYLNQLPNSTYFLEKGDFWRINNVTLGYTLPKKLLEKYHVERLRFFVSAQNLATITGYSGYTPEINGSASSTAGTSPLSAGIDSSIYPTPRTIAFGFNLGF